MQTLELRRLVAFGRQVQGSADRNLAQLREIDVQLEQLDVAYEAVSQVNHAAEQYIDSIRRNGVPAVVDGVDLVQLFEDARDRIGVVYDALSQMHINAASSTGLHDDDCVVDALAGLVDETAELHNNLNTLAWLIGESIADNEEPLPGEFTNVDDLLAAMGR